MAKSRLNDTAGLTAPRRSGSGSESKSYSIRAIDNGFVCSETICNDDQYSSREYFSPTKPKVEMKNDQSEETGSVLAKAIKSMD